MTVQFFTSESVSEGHPDKIADQISDAILDDILKKDLQARVACETYIKTGIIIIGGEINTNYLIDFEKIAKNTIQKIGYTSSETGFDINKCTIINAIGKQSPDIGRGLNVMNSFKQGAGDQGIMFGYANNETDVLMPTPIIYAHQLVKKQAQTRKNKILPWLRPDAKSQITFQYKNNKIIGIDSVILSTQHSEEIDKKILFESVMDEIIKPVLPKKWITKNTKYFVNPAGRFVIGGPMGDCGLTGRKIIVDTYGGMARHGGGAFSGKDPSKVDRSGAYGARYVAKNIVAAGLADRFEIQISYAIGIPKPTSISIETFGTEKIKNKLILDLIHKTFDLRPYNLIKTLNLLQPIYQKTATYGHFGRLRFPWEKLDKVNELRTAAGLNKD